MNENLQVQRLATTKLPSTLGGVFTAIAYKDMLDNSVHIALVKGEFGPDEEILVRIHAECLTGDTFGSTRCDCGEQMHKAMGMIKEEGKGLLLYMKQEGRGIGLVNKLRAYELQDKGLDTVEANTRLRFEADLRDYDICARILHDLGVNKVRLMTNNPDKLMGMKMNSIKIMERIPIEMEPHDSNIKYLTTKKKRLGHLFENI